ncbi:t(6)A37 threonylcarbamoyladenosine biosynthesis protein RimN [Candidatus Rubidus massiliensis]|nr:MAG: threonylcarbamoyl-AMP synthase [Chlamydia sp. 32-24]CDZ79802.1 t(6)A37 threonylcarbamoyladenosine biosynthesis protein RimN [Candidatus Rubidus massiliensis]
MRVSLKDACQLLEKGDIVALPTETVYGLASKLTNPSSIEKIYQAKGRPSQNPLIIHVANINSILSFLKQPINIEIFEEFWPGPLTIVLPIIEELVPSIARANLPTAAFRIPSHPLALKIIEEVGPIVMPSANLSGKPSATHPNHVEVDFGSSFPVLDGGSCTYGLESTILIYNDCKWQMIRKGAYPSEAFKKSIGYIPEFVVNDSSKPLCPGQLFRHYAPNTNLILSKSFPPQALILGFYENIYPKESQVWYLGSLNKPEQIAENLYAFLRKLDEKNISVAYFDTNFAVNGLMDTVLERITKAASKV